MLKLTSCRVPDGRTAAAAAAVAVVVVLTWKYNGASGQEVSRLQL